MESVAAVPETVTCRGERFRLYLDEETIQRRVREIGEQIAADYADLGTPILIGVLNGAFMFTADLMRAIPADSEVDFYKLSSYGERKVSSGQVTELKNVDAELEGRHVIVVEDIVDTGHSMEYVLDQIRSRDPASLRSATLLRKPRRRQGGRGRRLRRVRDREPVRDRVRSRLRPARPEPPGHLHPRRRGVGGRPGRPAVRPAERRLPYVPRPPPPSS